MMVSLDRVPEILQRELAAAIHSGVDLVDLRRAGGLLRVEAMHGGRPRAVAAMIAGGSGSDAAVTGLESRVSRYRRQFSGPADDHNGARYSYAIRQRSSVG